MNAVTQITLTLAVKSQFLSVLFDHSNPSLSVTLLRCLILFTVLFSCFICQRYETESLQARIVPNTHTHEKSIDHTIMHEMRPHDNKSRHINNTKFRVYVLLRKDHLSDPHT